MTEINPWFDKDGFKLMDDNNLPFDCDRCPCICTVCDAFGSDSSEWPDGFQRGVRFEVYGVPCSGECGDELQFFEIDYSDYASQHPGWETCAWRVKDEDSACWHWYVVTPSCEIYEWAYVKACCDTCGEHSEYDCFEMGYRWEVTGIPCGGTCHDAPVTFSVDYTWYHDLHQDWFTCKWCERDGDCIRFYAVNPWCEVEEWAAILDCESSSSGSSSSGSSSSGSSSSGSSSSSSSSSSSTSIEGCYCQEVLEIRLKEWYTTFFIGNYPCGGVIPSMTPEELVAYIISHNYQQSATTIKNYFCLDAEGHVIEGTRQEQVLVGYGVQGDNAVYFYNVGCVDTEGNMPPQDPYPCDHCVWEATPYRSDRPIYYVKSETKVDGPADCRNPEPDEPWMMMAVPDEDELI